MKDKFSVEIQKEIEEIILKIQKWKNLFNIKVEFLVGQNPGQLEQRLAI